MSFRVLSATTDRAEWDSLFQRLPPPQLDVHFSSAYLRAQEVLGGKGILAVLQLSGEKFVAQPFIMSEVATSGYGIGGFFDLTSAYGFGGPVTNLESLSRWEGMQFQTVLTEWARNYDVVGEYCVLHPLLHASQLPLVRETTTITWTKDVVVIEDLDGFDLTQVARRIRRGVKEAEAKGAIVRERPDPQLFHQLYEMAMDRLDASTRWRRPARYWFEHNNTSALGAHWFCTAANGIDRRMLLTVGLGEAAYAHYLGADHRARIKGLDEVTYYRAAVTLGLFHGFKRFHLGGGLSAGDSLEAFKSGFSETRYRVGSYYRVFRPGAYDTLVERTKERERAEHGRESTATWWPEYRRPFE